ncbi:hypothetical protein [Pontibacillus marinus]|uniref:Uncharacterized protein n=1 Tax=Pontibacillus marinus BH030004 = DSM 16465 TaxID=1385511 RepID=A0A0A5FS20_9BACI|nr:hypothetical protein [Pontibacillus marinus]KGX83541.1 hypothetical protein N783_02710 [Pontibacillus marinus BH030004 = DSM 16465]
MKELVGYCTKCEQEVFCLNGFLEGEVTNEKEIICYKCLEEKDKKTPRPNDQGE